ncbi:MAG: TrkH family potassium uptake protein [Bacteroides sp.]|nr:TrkH family potassium uptake protein [Bacteroides sp.]MCM1379893.1 TrkH family potassium uptake protein [Bacteroides sp.]MCM1446253.1 TrkH family potassium uptake protein [Prevotella sp.]
MRRLNFAMLGKTLCALLLFEAAFMLVPFFVAWFHGEIGAMQAFGIGAAATILVGGLGFIGFKPGRHDLSKYDAVLLTTSIWIVFSLFGLIPYMLAPTTRMTFSEAFFEAMSGFTTTGATLVPSTDDLSHAIHIWHCLSEWIGGLGIILFTLALVPMLNSSGGMQMFNAEQNKISQDKVSPRISATARKLWGVYILLTLALFGLLCIGPMPVFDAACHALATMSTGGFSTTTNGINTFATPYVKIIVTLFMFLGGVNFALVYRAATGQPRAVVHNEAFRTYCKVIAFALVAFVIGILLNGAYSGWQSVTIDPLFQVVSLITSTGYMLSSFDGWGPAIVAIAVILMFTGGCAGSTSGGAKIDRIVYLLKFLKNSIIRALRPNAVLPVRISNRVVPSTQVSAVVAFLCLYAMLTAVGALLISVSGIPAGDSFVSALGAMSNSSLSSVDSVIGCNYLRLNPMAHYVLAALMLIGRLEIFSVLIIFTPTFWHK